WPSDVAGNRGRLDTGRPHHLRTRGRAEDAGPPADGRSGVDRLCRLARVSPVSLLYPRGGESVSLSVQRVDGRLLAPARRVLLPDLERRLLPDLRPGGRHAVRDPVSAAAAGDASPAATTGAAGRVAGPACRSFGAL